MENITHGFYDRRKFVQEKVLNALKNIDFNDPDWKKPFIDWDQGTIDSIVIWYLDELIKKREYIDEIFEVAKLYANFPIPDEEGKNLNKAIIEGEEIRNIYTIKGSICWLLTSIASTFETKHYPAIIEVIEKLAFDPIYYVRIQATVPISFFAQNIRAQQHPDGSPFNFSDFSKDKIIKLSFAMLEEHRDLPRVLEGVFNIFNALRWITQTQAQQVVGSFFYDTKRVLQPEYLTSKGVPLLIFFAEYRSILEDGFIGKWFQDFAIELLKRSEEEAPYLRSTFIWHTWKEIEADFSNYEKLKKYIPYFLHVETYELESLGQYEFLVKEVITKQYSDGFELFKKQLEYIEKWAGNYNIADHAPWFLDTKEIIDVIAKTSKEDYLFVLHMIRDIALKGVYVPDLEVLFRTYRLVANSHQIESQVRELYKEIVHNSKWSIGKFSDEL